MTRSEAMTISSISSASQQVYAPAAKEASEATRGGRDIKNDGDSDDRGGAAAAVKIAAPAVNTSGQTTGQLINTTA
jgi:hypothetical protein